MPEMDEYVKLLQEMTDEELEHEWQEKVGLHLTKVKHEMAMRFPWKSQAAASKRKRGNLFAE